jgi:hypothetical protein
MAATPRGHIETSTSKSPTWKWPPGSARRLHPPHHQAGARPGQDPHARCRLARRAVCRTLDELHLCPPRPAGVVDELRLTLCSTLSERTSAYGFKAAPRGRSRRRPSLPLLPAKTPVGWREEIMTGVEPPPPCKVAAPSAPAGLHQHSVKLSRVHGVRHYIPYVSTSHLQVLHHSETAGYDGIIS